MQFEEDTKGRDLVLRLFRDELGREVDFVVTENSKPILLIEIKLSDRKPDSTLVYLKKKIPHVRAIQVCMNLDHSFKTPEGVEVCRALDIYQEWI